MKLPTVKYILTLLFLTAFCTGFTGKKEVVIYTSVDQIFSEPILKAYEKRTGVKVKAVYDVEAAKTTGLVNRLLAERKRPRADVFWNSEVGKTLALQQKGVLAPYRSPSARGLPAKFVDKTYYWAGFAARARVLIYNSSILAKEQVPRSIFDLTSKKWRGKVAMAFPLFGTTATHTAALYTSLGQKRAEIYLKALAANNLVVVNGNSVVRDLVAEGKLPIGFTDTDDVNVAIHR